MKTNMSVNLVLSDNKNSNLCKLVKVKEPILRASATNKLRWM